MPFSNYAIYIAWRDVCLCQLPDTLTVTCQRVDSVSLLHYYDSSRQFAHGD